MKANPGGEIDPKDVVGRDQIVSDLWAYLDQQSVVVVAERRIGKTTIAKCMRAWKPEGRLLLYRDVENVSTPIEFVERVAQDIEGHLSTLNKGLAKARKLLRHLAGTEVAGFLKLPPEVATEWKSLLERVVEDLLDHQGNTLCVLVWDELPLMIRKIMQTSGPKEASEVLDALRNLRQTHSAVRMMFSGSIGLHHVESELRSAGHTNDSTNDMRTVEIPPLSEEDATLLASELLRGEEVETTDPAATSRSIAIEVDCIPFYIHNVVSTIKASGETADKALVSRIVQGALTDAQDAWHLKHYRDRLDNYYGTERLPVVLRVLDEVAVNDGSVTFQSIFDAVKGGLDTRQSKFAADVVLDEGEALRTLLNLMQRDHYLRRDTKGTGYLFAFDIVKRWWLIYRDLVK